MTTILVEGCVEHIDGALRAEAAGCGRIELCVSLPEGGVTPSVGLIAGCVEALSIPVHVLVRPRGGDFVYSTREIDVIYRDLMACKTAGAAGVVIGMLTAERTIDIARVREAVQAARPLTVGFHRAFDQLSDPLGAMEELIDAGVSIILTSGGAATAVEGAARLRTLVNAAGEAATILAGGKVTASNARALVDATGVRAVHASNYHGLASSLA
jgi:copper homeostasis protein